MYIPHKSGHVSHTIKNYVLGEMEQWGNNFPHCDGKTQSPINIDTTRVVYDENLKPFNFYNYYNNLYFNLTNSGQTGISSF